MLMVNIYVTLVRDGVKTIDEVPLPFREEVQKILDKDKEETKK